MAFRFWKPGNRSGTGDPQWIDYYDLEVLKGIRKRDISWIWWRDLRLYRSQSKDSHDEGQVHLIGNEGIISADDDLQNLTDGELEENNDQLQEALGDLKEAVIPDEDTEGKDQAIGEMGKKKGARKGLFKSISVAGGSTKARMDMGSTLFGIFTIRNLPWNDHGDHLGTDMVFGLIKPNTTNNKTYGEATFMVCDVVLVSWGKTDSR
ncbi:hypothetical protein F2Q68_00029521 [Brassica cretica]|uniref:Uncharacterized protein n=1 Tax=Brassica cretica TaxID=69181 RepID=A0A8S9GE77_BRACR|nr:hypothetical protein F2Q68_00029521 [Brassica cretica]